MIHWNRFYLSTRHMVRHETKTGPGRTWHETSRHIHGRSIEPSAYSRGPYDPVRAGSGQQQCRRAEIKKRR